MIRLWDPIFIEATPAADIPIQFEGGDAAIIPTNPLLSTQDLANLREVLLANAEPKILGGVLRDRLFVSLKGCMIPSQMGEGFGPGCEVAHLGADAYHCIGEVRRQTIIKVYVDVVQAFASIVAALTLPMSGRDDVIGAILSEHGFSSDEVVSIVEEGRNQSEWDGTSEHLRKLVGAFQDSQWISTDYGTGVLAPKAGTPAGVPLAGLAACVALSNVTRRIGGRLRA